MKKYILLLFLCTFVYGQGTNTFHWHMDNRTPEVGTPALVWNGARVTLWTTVKCEGDSALYDSTANDYVRLGQAAYNIIPNLGTTGAVEFAFYINVFKNTGTMFETYQSAANYMLFSETGTATNINLSFVHRGNSNNVTCATTGAALQDSTWYWARIQWHQGGDTTIVVAIYSNNAGEVGTQLSRATSQTALNTFSTLFNYLYFGSGQYSAAGNSNYIDRITIYNDWYWWNPHIYIASTRDNKEFKKYTRFKKFKKF